MADDYKVINEIKNESRLIQQKITALEYKMNEFQSKHEALNKIIDMEIKVNKMELMLTEDTHRNRSCLTDVLHAIERLRDDMQVLKHGQPAKKEDGDEMTTF